MPNAQMKDELNAENINKDLNAGDDNPKAEELQILSEKLSFGTLPLKNEKLRKKALNAVTSRLESVKSDHDNRVKDWDRWESTYKNARIIENKTTLAQVNCAQAFNAVEDWTASIMDTVMGVNPPFQVKGRRHNLPVDVAGLIRSVLWQKAGVDCGFEDELEIGSRDGVKTGTFAFKTPYQLDEEPTLKVVQVPVEGAPMGTTMPTMVEEVEIEDRPVFKALDIRKLYFKPNKRSWIIERIDSNWSVIKKQAKKGIYGNLEKAEKTQKPTDEDTQDSKKDSDTEEVPEAENIDGDVELLEAHHVPLMLTAEGLGNDPALIKEFADKKVLCIITVANGTEVIRIQPTKYRKPPYIIEPFIPQRGTNYGIGILQIIEHLVVEYNTRRNQSLDANTFGLYCMTVINTKYLKKGQQLKKRPDGVIEFKGGDRPLRDMIDFVRPPTEYVTANFAIMDRMENEIKTATRLKGVMSGEKIAPNITATEMASIMKEALKSMKLIYRRIDRGILQEYFQRAYVMMVLNRQKSWTVEVESKELKDTTWREVSPHEIYSNGIEIEMLGVAHMEDEIVKTRNNMQALDLAAKFVPGAIPNDNNQLVIFDRYKAINEMLYMLGKDKPESWWKLMPNQPPLTPEGQPGMPAEGGPGGPEAPAAPGVEAGAGNIPDELRAALGGGPNA